MQYMWLDKLGNNIKQKIINKGLPLEQIHFIKDWPVEVIELILDFRMGYNKTLQVINYLYEISLRNGNPIDTPLKNHEWLKVYNNPKISMYQKGLWLRKFLFSKRYPIYTWYRSRIKETKDNEILSLEKDSPTFKIEGPVELLIGYSLPSYKTNQRLRSNTQDQIAMSKKNICYLPFKGRFLKKCPGTPEYLCCNYYVLNIQTNCNYDCQYCILQGYINNPRLNIYTNIDTALKEVEELLNTHPSNFYRIGTGELTDSLSLDHLTNTSSILIPFFMRQKNALLELKTKSKNIKNLLKFQPNGNIVVSWSLNPQKIIDEYETKTASLLERLESARQCSKSGYKIGFHLDPVILYPDWEDGYKNLIEQIFRYVEPKAIVWISIAGFRYTPRLKNIIQNRFPKTRLFLEEFVRCRDGKYRYIRPIRVMVYKKIINWIKNYSNDIPIYFCMESPTVWMDVFGKLPNQISNLKKIF